MHNWCRSLWHHSTPRDATSYSITVEATPHVDPYQPALLRQTWRRERVDHADLRVILREVELTDLHYQARNGHSLVQMHRSRVCQRPRVEPRARTCDSDTRTNHDTRVVGPRTAWRTTPQIHEPAWIRRCCIVGVHVRVLRGGVRLERVRGEHSALWREHRAPWREHRAPWRGVGDGAPRGGGELRAPWGHRAPGTSGTAGGTTSRARALRVIVSTARHGPEWTTHVRLHYPLTGTAKASSRTEPGSRPAAHHSST